MSTAISKYVVGVVPSRSTSCSPRLLQISPVATASLIHVGLSQFFENLEQHTSADLEFQPESTGHSASAWLAHSRANARCRDGKKSGFESFTLGPLSPLPGAGWRGIPNWIADIVLAGCLLVVKFRVWVVGWAIKALNSTCLILLKDDGMVSIVA